MKRVKFLILFISIIFFAGCNDSKNDISNKNKLTSNSWYESNSINEIYRMHTFTDNEYIIYTYASKDFSEIIDTKVLKILKYDEKNDKFDAIYDGKKTTCSYTINGDEYLNFGCSPNVENSLNCFGAWKDRSLAIANDF